MSASIESVVATARFSYSTSNHLINEFRGVISRYPSLRPNTVTYNDRPLLSLEGTLPITYKGTRYNIPVRFLYQDGYPHYPMTAQVIPTSDMSLKISDYVDSNGGVKSLLLQNWSPSYNTSVLADEMIKVFSASPPVYAKSRDQPDLSKSQRPGLPQSQQVDDETCALVQSYFDEVTKQLDNEISTLRDEEKLLKDRSAQLSLQPSKVSST